MTKRSSAPTFHWRYSLLLGGFGLCALLLLGQLFRIQIMEHQDYVVRAAEQHGEVETIPATRGVIRSSDGFDLATNQPAYLIYAMPPQIKDAHQAAEQIVQALQTPPPAQPAASVSASLVASGSGKLTPAPSIDQQVQAMEAKLGNKQLQWVTIARKVGQTQADKIKAMKFKGIGFEDEQKRYYPEGTLASQVLGFVGQDTDGNDHGYYGIEGYFDNDLRGKDGKILLEHDAAGNPIPVGNYQDQPVEQGADITLTLNRGLQYQLEQLLQKGVQDMGAVDGSVIVEEPATGRILTLANFPTYDPSQWNDPQVQANKLFKDIAISNAYEPGSVMKSFTTATGIELGLMTPDTTYHSGPYKVGDKTITTADNKYYGTATVTEMLEHSDNTGAAQFGLKIGADRMLDWMHKIGFDRPTGITLEGEGSGIIPPRQDWLPITTATAAFGQGVSVTPIQLLQMMATIANNGVEMKPTIIQSVAKNGHTTDVQPESEGRVYSVKTTDEMDDMLQKVVDYGEFHREALQGWQIAGKTSTAQIPVPGGYDQHNVITTFAGYAPAKNPKFVMLVKLDKPKILNSAETVVPVWMDMAKVLFRYYGMAPGPTPVPLPTPTP